MRSAAIYSHNEGKDWTKAVPIKGAGCARPRLLKLAAGPLLLSGGRLCVEDTDDISMWLNSDGQAQRRAASCRASGPRRPSRTGTIACGRGRRACGSTRRSTTATPSRHSCAPAPLCVLPVGPLCSLIAAGCLQAYTSLIPSGPSSGVIIYQKFYSPMYWPPWPQATFMMRFRVV